jgi:hypothetical protein
MILDWLCPSALDPQGQQEEWRAERVPQTSHWIKTNPFLQDWLGPQGSWFWIYGACIFHLAQFSDVEAGLERRFSRKINTTRPIP